MINLQKLRKERTNLKQREVAELINVSGSVLSRYETGKQPVPVDIIIKLAKIYNVTTGYIMETEVKEFNDLTLEEIDLILAFRKAGLKSRWAAIRLLVLGEFEDVTPVFDNIKSR